MSEKILFVDDEPRVLQGVQRQLHRDFNLVTADGGQAGLAAIAKDGPFAVVVSDMRMPQMNGVEFTRPIKALQPDLPVLLFTPYPEQDVLKKALAVDAAHVFVSPMSIDKVFAFLSCLREECFDTSVDHERD